MEQDLVLKIAFSNSEYGWFLDGFPDCVTGDPGVGSVLNIGGRFSGRRAYKVTKRRDSVSIF
jgi:hypothetical protein